MISVVLLGGLLARIALAGDRYALCLTGEVRTLPVVWSSWLSVVIDPAPVDVFAHVYLNSSDAAERAIMAVLRAHPTTRVVVTEQFDPAMVKWSCTEEQSKALLRGRAQPMRLASMYRQIRNCLDSVEKAGQPYALVMRGRTDVVQPVSNVFPWRALADASKQYDVFIPLGNDFDGLNDQFSVGKPAVMARHAVAVANAALKQSSQISALCPGVEVAREMAGAKKSRGLPWTKSEILNYQAFPGETGGPPRGVARFWWEYTVLRTSLLAQFLAINDTNVFVEHLHGSLQFSGQVRSARAKWRGAVVDVRAPCTYDPAKDSRNHVKTNLWSLRELRCCYKPRARWPPAVPPPHFCDIFWKDARRQYVNSPCGFTNASFVAPSAAQSRCAQRRR